ALLPALALPATARPAATRPLRPRRHRRLSVPEGSDLRLAQSLGSGDAALRSDFASPGARSTPARSRRLPAGRFADAARAGGAARSILRERDGSGISGGAPR